MRLHILLWHTHIVAPGVHLPALCAPLTGGYYNVTNTVETQFASVTSQYPQKLILGMPYYGVQWNTQTSAAHSLVRKFNTYTVFADDIVNAGSAGMLWANDQQSPWYITTADTGWTQTWFDNDSSIALKCRLAQSKNYAGVGIWALGYDRDRTELWNKLYAIFYQSNAIHDASMNLKSGTFVLRQNYPNPFNPTTNISFSLYEPGYVTMRVYDVMGSEVAKPVDREYNAGNFNHFI